MFERYPSKKDVDVAYQGDFEDAAWTKFSEGQLPPTRVTLKDFAEHPFVPGEITSKSEYVRHVITWFSKALVDAGYKSQEVDGLIQKSFDVIDFSRPAEAYVADINRIIQDFYRNAPGATAPVVENQLQTAEAQPQAATVNTPPPVVVTVNPSVNTNPNTNSLDALTEKSDEATVRADTDFDDRAAEYSEYGNRQIKPVVPAPEVQTVAPVMPVIEANEPIVLETIPEPGINEAVVAETVSNYQSKLDALNEQPFDNAAYFEYFLDVHTGLRSRYDAVVNEARENLKRYSQTYTPSKTEKEALQFLSSLQGQYAKMQHSGSDIDVIREQLMNGLQNNSTEITPEVIKTLTQNYTTAVEKFLSNVTKLEGLIAVAKTEEKPPQTEAYRALFEKMRIEGNQVLQSLAIDHPLYTELKTAIEVNLPIIIQAAAENEGDKNIIDNSTNFIARREQIQELITFIKKEQEYQDFFKRAHVRVQKLESDFENIPDSSKSESVKKQLAENIVKVKQALAETTSVAVKVGVLESLREQKDVIQGLLLESSELIKTVPKIEANATLENPLNTVPDEELLAAIKGKMIKDPHMYVVLPEFVELYGRHIAAKRERQQKLLENPTNYERFKKLAGKIPLGNITKAAALVLVSALPLGQENKQTGNPMLEGTLAPTSLLSRPNIDYPAIAQFLQTVEAAEAIENSQAPVVPETVPGLPATPEEIIPGVTLLPDDVSLPDVAVSDNPLEVYSDNADAVPSDPGIVFESPKDNTVPEILRKPYTINIGDNFWDINEGQTIAGKLPVLGQINPYFKQALIDRMRDRINSDEKLRDAIGGIGKTADQLVAGKLMNLDKLNELGVNVAIEYGYLK